MGYQIAGISEGPHPHPHPLPSFQYPGCLELWQQSQQVAWPVEERPHIPSWALSSSSFWDAAPQPAWTLRPLLSAAPRTPWEGLFMSGLSWPGYCARRGEEEGHPLPLMCLASQSCVPPASLGTAALPEHPSPGPGLPLNLPQETSSRCWRTGCSSGSLRAPGGQDRGRFGWSEVKTTSIALARTLCNPLDKLGEARERGRTLDQEWEEVEVGVSGLEEAERDNIWPRTLIIRESISTILISLSCQRSQSP